MPELRGLPDTAGTKECEFFNSVSRARAILRKGLAATSAGDDGAINVWKDDNGKWQCEAMRYMVTQDSQTCDRVKDIEPWVRTWLKKIHRQ